MRINKFIAQATGLSRRAADAAIYEGRVLVNGQSPSAGQAVSEKDVVTLDDTQLNRQPPTSQTIMLNKPADYVCSRNGQGSATIYDLLPAELHILKPVGRLDKDSTGLLLLTNDGDLANQLTHPRYAKTKVYEVKLDKPLEPFHRQLISDRGVQLEDGPSKLALAKLNDDSKHWQVTMQEGRNRQIRRTFEALGYRVTVLNRQQFGSYQLSDLAAGHYRTVTG